MKQRHKYSEEWFDTIRPAILKRDDYKCTECRIKHRTWVAITSEGTRITIDSDEVSDYKTNNYKVYRIFLQVAHLDNNKSNNDYANLKSLCVKCHAIKDREWKKLLRKSNNKYIQKTLMQEIEELSKYRPTQLNNNSNTISK